MAEERLQITLEADVAGATAAIDKFSSNLSKTLPAATAKAASGLDKIGKSASNATPSLINFSRVISDAPFGILGVANNLDPLLSSFQSLKKESGSTSGALKALFAGLAGPAGIAIGLSAVTSAFIAFGPQIKAFFAGTQAATEEQKKFNEELNQAKANALKTGIQLQALAAIANDSNQSDKVRVEALKQVNSETEKYGITITQAGIASGDAAKEIDKLTASLVQQAVAAKFADKVADLKVREAEVSKKASDATKDEFDAKSALTKLDRKKTDQALIAQQVELLGIQSTKEKKAASQELAAIQKELTGTEALYKTALVNSLDVTKKSTTATQAKASAQKQVNTEKAASVELLNEELLLVDELLIREQNRSRYASLVTSGPAGAGITAPVPLPSVANKPGGVTIDENKLKILNGKVGTFAQTILALKENMESIAELGIGGAIDSVFTAIQNGDNVFKALGDSVKGFVIELVKAVAKALILQAIMTALFPQGAAAQAATGGGFITKLLGGVLGGRAGGGPVTPGGGYIVGENGPEKFYPSQPGMIVPNGGGGGGTLSARISGNSLLFLLNQAGQNSRMNFG